jgi:hypothetical protein
MDHSLSMMPVWRTISGFIPGEGWSTTPIIFQFQ